MFKLSRPERISILFLVGVLVLGGILHMARILLSPLPQVPLPVLQREIPQEMPLVPRGLEVPEGEIAPEMIWEETPEIVIEPVSEQFPEAKEVPIPVVETSKIDINTASLSELQNLPGIGPVKAQAIIDARPYYSIDELTRARGIGPKTLERLRDLVTIGVGKRMPGAGIEIATHRVREGDTLSKIAEKYLGVASAFQELALYNRIKDPDYIFPGEMIRIPCSREGVTLISAALAEEGEVRQGKVNINTAPQSELESLPGIGPAKAQAIINNRPYYDVDELTQVMGIGPKILEGLRPLITVGEVTKPAPETPTEREVPVVKRAEIDINTASLSEIQTLPGIGPVKARAIIDARPYYSVDELTRARGIGPKTLVNLMPLITVGKVTKPAPETPIEGEAPVVKRAEIDINTASLSELQNLPGIGPVTAQAIINARPYYTINELTKARGIGPKTLEQLRPLITVGEGIEGALEPEAPAPKEPGKININTASSLEIQTLPGIGPVTAQAIIDARPYYSIDELTRAQGIGLKTIERLRPLITIGEAPPGERAEVRKGVSRKVNINTASQRELESLPGIGPKTAKRIIEYRPFGRTSDIQNVPRIGSKTYEKLRTLITVEKPDINSLSYQKLSAMPDIGPGMARSIIDYREGHGPFRSMRELKDIPGMDNETYRFLKSYFTIE